MARPRTPRTVGEVIRAARQALGYSTWQLADRSGISQSSVVRIERGQGKQPSADHLRRLAPVLGLAPAELFALAGYTAATDLPTLPTYLRTKYRDYPDDARVEVEQFITALINKYDSSPPTSGDDRTT